MIARNPDKLKADLLQSAKDNASRLSLTKGEMGAVIGHLKKAFGDDVNRRLALAWLFGQKGELSTKALDNGQWFALWDWVGFWQDENEQWQTRLEFPVEAAFALTKALQAQNQPGAPEFVDNMDMLYQSISQLDGVITHVEGNDNHGVEADMEYWLEKKAKQEEIKKKVQKFIDGDDLS